MNKFDPNKNEEVIYIPVRREGVLSSPATSVRKTDDHAKSSASQQEALSNNFREERQPVPNTTTGDSNENELKKQLKKIESQYLQNLVDSKKLVDRIEREARRECLNEKKVLLLELLEVMDNFERALSYQSNGDHAWRRGIMAIYQQIFELLNRYGVQPIKAIGKPFNPHYHEAVDTVVKPDIKNGVVLDEIQKGYILNSELLRPSRVRVVKNQ